MKLEERKLLTLMIAGAVFFAILFVVSKAYIGKWQYYNKIIDGRTKQLSQYKQQVANKPALSEELKKLDGLVRNSGIFMEANSVDSASNELLRTVQKIINDSEGTISTSKVNANTRNQKTVSATFDFSINNNGFVDILQHIYSSKPLLKIEDMTITPQSERKNISDNPKRPKFEKVETGILSVRMTILSYLSLGDYELNSGDSE